MMLSSKKLLVQQKNKITIYSVDSRIGRWVGPAEDIVERIALVTLRVESITKLYKVFAVFISMLLINHIFYFLIQELFLSIYYMPALF